MLDQETLLSRLASIAQLKNDLLDQHHHPLMGELLERFELAQDILGKVRQKEDPAFSDLMFAAFCLNRCEAIGYQIEAAGASSAKNVSVGSKNVLDFAEDRILTRWLLARATWLRSKLLNYSNHYQSPPLSESISILLVQRLDRNGRLFRLLRKLQSRT